MTTNAGLDIELEALPSRPESVLSRAGDKAPIDHASPDPSPQISPTVSRVPSWTGTLSRVPPATSAFSLPPTDRGRHAYTFLAASFVIETVLWGVRASSCRMRVLAH